MPISPEIAEKIRSYWRDLKLKKDHPSDCLCWVCLYRYQPKKRRYGAMLFFLDWLIEETRIRYIIQNGKTIKIRYRGRWTWAWSPRVYKETPLKIRRISKGLEDLYYKDKEGILLDFDKLFEKQVYVYLHRVNELNFQRAKDELAQKKWLETMAPSSKQRYKWRRTWDAFRKSQDVANYVYVQPNRTVAQRKLLRDLRISRHDLIPLRPWLRYNYGIFIDKKYRSWVYHGKMKSSGGRVARYGVMR